MRRGVMLVLVAALVAAAAPIEARAAHSVGYQYLTTYSGTYDFSDSFRAAPKAPDGIETREHFEWVSYDYETIVVSPDHAFTQTLTSYILARGTHHATNIQGSSVPGGPFTTTSSCSVYSDTTPVVIKGGGAYIQPVVAKQNPLLELGWTLPDYGGNPARYRPRFHVSGTADCPRNSSTFLAYTPSQGDGTVFAHPGEPPSAVRAFGDAFSGTAAVHYAAIASHPWTRRFAVTLQDLATSPGFSGPAVDSAKVVVRSLVKFGRVAPTTLRDPPHKRDKIADLLISEGFGDLAMQGPANGPPAGATGDADTVVIPGFGAGDVSIDVNGTVLSPGQAQARDAAAASPLLASARTRVRRGAAPVRLTIAPTAVGRRLLKRPHRAFRARYTLRFRPAGSRNTYRGVRVFTVPARP